MNSIIITGGKGFIGSHMLIRLACQYPERVIVNIDAETYAARPPLSDTMPENILHEKIDIRDQLAVHRIMKRYSPEACVHMAAESHVCRSITGPKDFITTNVMGTFNLLEEFKESGGERFIHISTDEVFGEIRVGQFNEDSPMLPRNPYAASKASSDLLVRAYHETYNMDTVTLNMANNFGPNQHYEKLIPRTIQRIMERKPIIVHGRGDHIREWLWVDDSCDAIMAALKLGRAGERYCLAGERETTNLKMMEMVFLLVNERFAASDKFDITHTNDRPTDDFRYSMSSAKANAILGWAPMKALTFREKLKMTVDWYLDDMKRSSKGLAPHGRGA